MLNVRTEVPKKFTQCHMVLWNRLLELKKKLKLLAWRNSRTSRRFHWFPREMTSEKRERRKKWHGTTQIFCLVRRRLSLDKNLRRKEGENEKTGDTFASLFFLPFHGPLLLATSHSRFAFRVRLYVKKSKEEAARSWKWRVISMEFLRSFLRRDFEVKRVVASPNVGCFLRLTNCPTIQ